MPWACFSDIQVILSINSDFFPPFSFFFLFSFFLYPFFSPIFSLPPSASLPLENPHTRVGFSFSRTSTWGHTVTRNREAKERKRWRKNSSSITCSQANGGLLTYESLCYNYLRLPLYPYGILWLYSWLCCNRAIPTFVEGIRMMSTARFSIAYDIRNGHQL